MIRVLIVDDTKILCHAIEAMLKQDGETESVGMVHDGREVIKVCRNTKPDVVWMDIS